MGSPGGIFATIVSNSSPHRRLHFMSSLAEIPELVGFFSYSREDDEDSGALSALRGRIQRELRAQLGRTLTQFKLWQDTVAIAHGTLWEEQIKSAIDQSVFSNHHADCRQKPPLQDRVRIVPRT
jgi:hypothetical protein